MSKLPRIQLVSFFIAIIPISKGLLLINKGLLKESYQYGKRVYIMKNPSTSFPNVSVLFSKALQ
jgi:hypothetical protein